MILTIRTDNPMAEIGLYNGQNKVSYFAWRADRKLAKELLGMIRDELKKQHAGWADITGVVVFKGPGSFTGLRIGITVANTIAYGNQIAVVGAEGNDWIAGGITRLAHGETDRIVLPHYGAEANITLPKNNTRDAV